MLQRVLHALLITVVLSTAAQSIAAPLTEGSYNSPNGVQKYFYRLEGERYGVIFEPMLPRSDTALIMAVNELAPKLLRVPTANCRPVAEGSVIAFRCATGNVFVLIMKDELSGQVRGLSMWGQRL